MARSKRVYARARRSDPSTSWQAAYEVERSGRAADQRALVLEVVQRRPGLTAAEIAKECGLERHAPSRRLPELERAGLVERGLSRVCSEQGRASVTWIARGVRA